MWYYCDFMGHCEGLALSARFIIYIYIYIIKRRFGNHTGYGCTVELGILSEAEEIGHIERVEGHLRPF